jgi:flagellar hook-basal body complex protein FliE
MGLFNKIQQAINSYNKVNNLNLTIRDGINDKYRENSKVDIFANFIKDNIGEQVSKIKHADNIAIQAVQGKADVTNVVVAFAEAEQVVAQITSIKQNLLTAINEILKMPI